MLVFNRIGYGLLGLGLACVVISLVLAHDRGTWAALVSGVGTSLLLLGVFEFLILIPMERREARAAEDRESQRQAERDRLEEDRRQRQKLNDAFNSQIFAMVRDARQVADDVEKSVEALHSQPLVNDIRKASLFVDALAELGQNSAHPGLAAIRKEISWAAHYAQFHAEMDRNEVPLPREFQSGRVAQVDTIFNEMVEEVRTELSASDTKR